MQFEIMLWDRVEEAARLGMQRDHRMIHAKNIWAMHVLTEGRAVTARTHVLLAS
jgi:hypothetical protein